jgi:dTDP-4-amino-4,6-dideoxygalactose transaminase
MGIKNFLPEQYRQTNQLDINHNYLTEQFSDHEEIWEKIREVVKRGDFTLGSEVDELEKEYAIFSGVKHAIGVGSGTDALFLSLKAIGVDKGDEVITTPFTFFATVGAIVTAGAKPVFCDAGLDYNIDASLIESKITSATKAIIPVHWAGKPCNMEVIETVAKKYQIPVISDACHAINASYKGRPSGALGAISCFSFHPLKNLNVWGDGGIITTNDSALADKLRLLRNHGLVGRDECQIFAYNSRLETVQAVEARHLLPKINYITECRVKNAHYFDMNLAGIRQIQIPDREKDIYQVFHIYSILCEQRDSLQAYLIKNGVDAKAHYPLPMHLQPAAHYLRHKLGDFPVAENIASKTLSLPVHEFITSEQQDSVVQLIKEFYA